ncbi:esterase [Nocardia sp. NBC_01730]|uniref:LGFP repeat-containing protein n=1 Tax=Nocardia sp. NBC_01730 TaxID=2975998 RepID=UPI002E15AE11|nr:esterase [Nocardia sp. NBC_01730]
MHHFARRTAGFTALIAAAGFVVASCSDDTDKESGAASITPIASSPMTTSVAATHTGEAIPQGAAEETKLPTQGGESVTVSGDIYEKYMASGGPTGPLGPPLEGKTDGPDDGEFQDFVGGTIYEPKEGEPHIVWGEIRAAWEADGGANGKLGYPISDEKNIPGGKQSDFSGGTITWVDGNITVTPK